MKKTFITFYITIVIGLISCNSHIITEEEKKIINILQCYKEAINQHDYEIIKPYLSNDFQTDNSDLNSSIIQFYSFINSNLSRKIDSIGIDKIERLNDSTIRVNAYQILDNTILCNTTFIFTNNDKPHLIKLFNYLPGSVITRTSVINNQIFGNNRIENIKNLSIIDITSGDSIFGNHFTTFYDDPKLKKHAVTALQLFEKLDSFLIYDFGFYDVERENLFLTSINSLNTCTIGNSRKIPWTMALYESDSINNEKMINKIGSIFSHEIVEGCLVVKYNLNGNAFRWFRDGLSDYIAYKFCSMISPDEAQRHFLDNRLTDFKKYQRNGNLLDWRGETPIEALDTGKIYGNKFIYSNEVGQYGRAFKFFKDLFDNNPNQISEILQKIRLTEDINLEKLFKIMDDVTNKNTIELISKY